MFFRASSLNLFSRQTGFTMLELLVVITLLAIVAGASVLSYEGVQDQGRADATDFEMSEIRKALLQQRRDSGSHDFPGYGVYDCTNINIDGDATKANTNMFFPTEAGTTDSEKINWCQSPANFWMLFSDALATGWDMDRKRGWKGPYLQRKSGYLDIDADYSRDGTLATESGTLINEVWGVASPYITEPAGSGDLTWRISVGSIPLNNYGTPYLLFDLDDSDKARLVHMGDNGVYDGNNATDICSPNNDDRVLCLLR